jgi:hypothetical protein
MITHVTLTGADHETPPHLLATLADAFPLVEFGILYSANPRGRPRYPDPDQIGRLGRYLMGRAKMALHVCGSEARLQLRRGELHALVWPCDRVQINGSIAWHDVTTVCGIYPTKTIITQDSGNGSLWREVMAPNHAILMDASGGRGQRPNGWLRQPTPKPCGFAGGLSPVTLPEELPRIMRVARGDWWFDAENGLRDHRDLFDVERARWYLETAFDIMEAATDTSTADLRK